MLIRLLFKLAQKDFKKICLILEYLHLNSLTRKIQLSFLNMIKINNNHQLLNQELKEKFLNSIETLDQVTIAFK